MLKACIIQLNSQPDKRYNLNQVAQLVEDAAAKDSPQLVALPEMFNFYAGTLAQRKRMAEDLSPSGLKQAESYQFLKALAQKYQIVLHGGSLCEMDNGHYYNTTVVFAPNGDELARYRKIHLFDVSLPNNETHQESLLLSGGKEVVSYTFKDWQIGCAICYDLRFSELFLQLASKKINMIIIPSAFTYQTGQAHWEILLRARAIETQSYILAPAQAGIHTGDEGSKKTWGHSMIIDPWGNIIAKLEEEVGFASADLDPSYLNQIKQRIPMEQHRLQLRKI